MPTHNNLYYTETKAADSPYPPLVLVHGAGGSHLDWSPELRRLPGVRVISLDLPGHGKSTGPGRTDIAAYADDVCTLLNALAVERAIVAGHSIGGAITQHIGLHYPDRTAGLILIGTGSKLPVDPTLPQRIVDEPEPTIKWLMEWTWSSSAPQELKNLGRERLIAVPTGILQGDYLACQQFDVRDRLEHIIAPTLVIGATDDHMVPLKFSVTLAERIPNATLVTVENAGHMFPLEQSQTVAHAVIQWLKSYDSKNT